MTTTIKISAHCSEEKEVVVEIIDKTTGKQVELIRMNDGDVADRVVYEGRELTVKEVLK